MIVTFMNPRKTAFGWHEVRWRYWYVSVVLVWVLISSTLELVNPFPLYTVADSLHECADSLSPAFQPIFQESVDSGTVPTLCKTSLIVPIPKKPKPTEMNHYRPVALTPLAMKCLEKIMLKNLLPFVLPHLDPLKFVYRSKRGVEDAIATLHHRLLKHFETPGHHACILFVDFSSAFNTI